MSPTSIIKPIKMQQIEARLGQSFIDVDSRLLQNGYSDAAIAEYLGISVNTLKDYRELLGVRPERTRRLVSA